MTLRHLSVFIAVCEYGTMTKAAEHLHIAQPAVSATVAELEKYYEVQLFSRINQRLVLTDAGKKLLLKAKAVVSAFDEFETLAEDGKEDPTVKIGATLTIGAILIPKILRAVYDRYPRLSPCVKISKASEIDEAILSGEIDFAFTEEETVSPSLVKSPFSRDRLVIVCKNDYGIAPTVSVSELTRHPLLVRENGSTSRRIFDRVIKGENVSYHAVMESQSNEALLSAAMEGIGVAALPLSLVRNELHDRTLREISVEGITFERNYYIVKHKSRQFSKAQQTVFDLCNSFRPADEYFGK